MIIVKLSSSTEPSSSTSQSPYSLSSSRRLPLLSATLSCLSHSPHLHTRPRLEMTVSDWRDVNLQLLTNHTRPKMFIAVATYSYLSPSSLSCHHPLSHRLRYNITTIYPLPQRFQSPVVVGKPLQSPSLSPPVSERCHYIIITNIHPIHDSGINEAFTVVHYKECRAEVKVPPPSPQAFYVTVMWYCVDRWNNWLSCGTVLTGEITDCHVVLCWQVK